MIDFDQLVTEHIPQMLGGVGTAHRTAFIDGHNKILRITLDPGVRIGMHTHTDNSEICFIASGTATVLFDDHTEVVHAGQCHYCPQGHSHSVGNDHDEPMTMYCVVPFHIDPVQ